LYTKNCAAVIRPGLSTCIKPLFLWLIADITISEARSNLESSARGARKRDLSPEGFQVWDRLGCSSILTLVVVLVAECLASGMRERGTLAGRQGRIVGDVRPGERGGSFYRELLELCWHRLIKHYFIRIANTKEQLRAAGRCEPVARCRHPRYTRCNTRRLRLQALLGEDEGAGRCASLHVREIWPSWSWVPIVT